MYSKLSVRDAWGRPKKFRSASEAGLTFQAPTAGLIFYAPLSASAATAETGQTLTTTGTVTYQQQNSIPCAYFGGSSYIDISGVASMPNGTSPRTISTWFRHDDTAEAIVFGYWDNSYLNGSRIIVSTMAIWDVWGTAGVSASISVDQWYHFLATYDGTTIKVYLDGTLMASGDFSLNGTKTYFTIGGDADAQYRIKGYVAAPRIYNRVLTASEISMLAREFRV